MGWISLVRTDKRQPNIKNETLNFISRNENQFIVYCGSLCSSAGIGVCKETEKVEAAPAPAEQPAAVEEEPTITEDCIINVSLFNESVKNKQFADAYGPWWEVYNTCPNANKAIYTQGRKIIDWKYENTQDPQEKERLRQLILEMSDKRIKYFGDDPKYPTAYILGQKALDYCDYFPESSMEPAYGWLKQSVEGMGVKSQMQVLAKFVDVSYALFKSDNNKYGEQLLPTMSWPANCSRSRLPILQTRMPSLPLNRKTMWTMSLPFRGLPTARSWTRFMPKW